MPLFYDKSSLITAKQAQQSHRFVLRVGGIDSALIKNVTVPSYTIETKKYSMLEYEFSYPTKVKWSGKVSFDIIQMLEKDTFYSSIGFFMSKLYNSNYYASPMGIGSGERDVILPNSFYKVKDNIVNFFELGLNSGYQRTRDEGTVLEISKQKLGAILGIVKIENLDEDGNIYDSWKLNGAFITSVTPTNLTYENETVSTIKVELSYDWADYGFRGVYAEEDSVKRIFGL